MSKDNSTTTFRGVDHQPSWHDEFRMMNPTLWMTAVVGVLVVMVTLFFLGVTVAVPVGFAVIMAMCVSHYLLDWWLRAYTACVVAMRDAGMVKAASACPRPLLVLPGDLRSHETRLFVRRRLFSARDYIDQGDKIAARLDFDYLTVSTFDSRFFGRGLILTFRLAAPLVSRPVAWLDGSPLMKIGRYLDTGADVFLDLRLPSHVAVQGQTRSGKSALMYLILGSVVASILDGSVRIYGVDPTALLLHEFEHQGGQVSIGPDDAVGAVDVLSSVKVEMDRRIVWMHEQDLDKIDRFSPEMPLIVLVIEEMPGIKERLAADDKANGRRGKESLASQWDSLVKTLLAESAKAGIRLVMIAQRFAIGEALDGSGRGNVGTAISMRLKHPESVAMLHPGLTTDQAKEAAMFSAGEGYIEVLDAPPRTFRSDFIGDYEQYLNRVRSVLGHPSQRLTVIDGEVA